MPLTAWALPPARPARIPRHRRPPKPARLSDQHPTPALSAQPVVQRTSGHFAANAAWLSIAAMAYNLVRAAGALASLTYAKARAAT
jgi:hypothetical protein